MRCRMQVFYFRNSFLQNAGRTLYWKPFVRGLKIANPPFLLQLWRDKAILFRYRLLSSFEIFACLARRAGGSSST